MFSNPLTALLKKMEKQLKKRHDIVKLHKGPDHQTRESVLGEIE
jgi:hypothetical protein